MLLQFFLDVENTKTLHVIMSSRAFRRFQATLEMFLRLRIFVVVVVDGNRMNYDEE